MKESSCEILNCPEGLDYFYLIFLLILLLTSSILARDCSVGKSVLMYSTALKSGRSKGSLLGIT